MFKMDNRILKEKIYEKCHEVHMNKIKNLESAMQDAEKSAHDYGQQSDIFDSHRMQLIGKRDMYAQQLITEMDLLETLHKIDITINHKIVSFGSVVITNMQKVFVSIGLGKITIENDTFYAISLQVPFYQAMRGLKKGDEFEFRGKKIKILDLF
jgi:hypothetical protein